MLRWVGSEGNLGAPDRQRLFFPDNIEPREEGAREVGGGGQEIIVCVSAITSLNMADFQPQRWILSSGETDVIMRTKATGLFFCFLVERLCNSNC